MDTDPALAEQILEANICGFQKRMLLSQLRTGKIEKKIIREIVCQLSELDLVLPEPVSARAVEAWYADLCDDVPVLDRWGEDDYLQIINLSVRHLAEKEPQWKPVVDLLPNAFGSDSDRMKEARGRAFAHVMPLLGQKNTLTDEKRRLLEEDYSILEDGSEPDVQLAQLLRKNLDTGAVRQRGEFKPYTAIIWELMGGESAWNRMYPMLKKERIQEWDTTGRQILSEGVTADYDTQTSILSIYMQSKGAELPVKSLFSHWLQLACKNGNSTAKFE